MHSSSKVAGNLARPCAMVAKARKMTRAIAPTNIWGVPRNKDERTKAVRAAAAITTTSVNPTLSGGENGMLGPAPRRALARERSVPSHCFGEDERDGDAGAESEEGVNASNFNRGALHTGRGDGLGHCR